MARRRMIVGGDNMVAVGAVNKGTAKDPALLAILRAMHKEQVKHSCELKAKHVPGVRNVLADLASRLKDSLPSSFPSFLSLSVSSFLLASFPSSAHALRRKICVFPAAPL